MILFVFAFGAARARKSARLQVGRAAAQCQPSNQIQWRAQGSRGPGASVANLAEGPRQMEIGLIIDRFET